MGNRNAWGMRLAAGFLALAATLPFPALAQLQRSFVNLGFEEPDVGASACVMQTSSSAVPGWDTTHASGTGNSGCTLSATPGPLIEIWANGFNGVVSREGTQHAELNAAEASRLYQSVCLINNETVGWRFSHRGRTAASDSMRFNIGTNVSGAGATVVARATDDSAGNGSVSECIAGGTCTRSGTATNGWRDYSGSFSWPGTTGVKTVGFQAIGGTTLGNFLDDIQVTLRPHVEFAAPAYSTREGQATPTLPQIRVSGTVPTDGGIIVLVNVTGGTAARPGDYTTPSNTVAVNVPVPKGTHDNALFSLPISIVNDTLVENNETVTFQILPNLADYNVTSTATCGGAAQSTSTLTILDNDVDVLTTKSGNTTTPAPGGTAVFTVTYRNNTARPTVGTGAALTMHDATVSLADAIPAGFTAFSWTCAASGTPTPVCPAASGSGAISTPATLPAGNGGAAGGTLTYTITGTLAATQCTSTTNTSTVTANDPVQEATASQSGFDTPVPGGTANNTASASVDPLCSDLAIFKTNTPAAGPGDQAADTVVSGTATTYSLRVVNIGPDAVTNARVTDTPAAGLTCPGALGSTVVTCTPTSSPAGATTCPASGVLTTTNLFSAGGITIPSIAVSPTPATPNNYVTLTFTCTVN